MKILAKSGNSMDETSKHTTSKVQKLVHRLCRFSSDDTAQAMTEFVIIIPIVLLTFFAAMQTMIIAEAAQFCNYAAFAAARSYTTGFAKFQRDGDPNPHQRATARARAVAAMALAPVSHGLNYMFMFPGDPTPYSTGELTGGMRALRQTGNSPDSLRQQLLEGFIVAFVFRIEGFRITSLKSDGDPQEPLPEDQDPRGTVDCQFTYRLPLALPGLAAIWNYQQRELTNRNITTDRIEDVGAFGPNDALADNAPLAGGRAFDPANMLGEVQDVLGKWHTPLNAGLANTLFTTYSQYYINGGSGDEVPANIRIGAKARVGFEPLVGEMP